MHTPTMPSQALYTAIGRKVPGQKLKCSDFPAFANPGWDAFRAVSLSVDANTAQPLPQGISVWLAVAILVNRSEVPFLVSSVRRLRSPGHAGKPLGDDAPRVVQHHRIGPA